MVFIGQELHALFEICAQEVFSNIEALELIHGFELLLSLASSDVKVLVLDLDSLDLFLDFTLPFLVIISLSLVILIFELTNLFNFMLFFNFKNSLVDTLTQKNIQDWINLFIVVKEIIVFNLCNFIDTCLLWDVFWSWWFWHEIISLQFHFCLCRFSFSLLSQEVSQIDLNSSRWAWS